MRILIFMLLTVGVVAGGMARAESWGPIEIVGNETAPGEARKFSFFHIRSYEGSHLDTPIFVARGASSGPTLCVTAGIHGDEINGIEIARRVFATTDPATLVGTLIALPAINADGFRSGLRYLPDRRDLNRYFPGNRDGSVATLLAHAVFENIIRRCDALVDLHTASSNRANLPQIRVDLENARAFNLARHFGVGIIIGGAGPAGSLRRAAMDAGVPAIIYEAGEPLRFQEHEIQRGLEGVQNVMEHLDMIPGEHAEVPESRIYRRARWVRVSMGRGGFFFPNRELGDAVTTGDLLATIVDPLTDVANQVVSPYDGDVIGMAVPQPVLSGYALFHIGVKPEDAR